MSAGRRARLATLLVAGAAALVLGGCGVTNPPVALPPAHSAAERQWIDNAGALIRTLSSDVVTSAVGGANLATARRALHDQSDVYSLLVAYDLFGDCGSALANAGTPSARASPIATTLIPACSTLERASTLFERAMRTSDAASLLAATRLVLTVEPRLVRAQSELSSLG